MSETKTRTLESPMLSFELAQEIEHLKTGHQWITGSRNAITLVKTSRIRVVLMLMRKGATMHEHRVEGPITVLVISGGIRFIADGEERTVRNNGLLTLDRAISHDLEALDEETALLLTII